MQERGLFKVVNETITLNWQDRRLLAALFQDPRSAWDVVANRLGVSVSTVSRRVKKLVEERYIAFVGEVSWSFFSTTLPVHLWINPRAGELGNVISRLVALPESQHVASMLGEYPVFCTLHAADEAKLFEVISDIQSWGSVERLNASPVLGCSAKASNWQYAYGARVLGELPRRTVNPLFNVDDLGKMPSVGASTKELAALAIVQSDCRVTAKEVASRISVSAPVAQRMIEQMLADGWFRPRVEVSPAVLGFEVPYTLRLNTRPETTERVLRKLSQHPSCRFVTQIAGASDIFATGVAGSRGELAGIVNSDVAHLEGVTGTRTDLIARDWKRYWSRRDEAGRILDFRPLPLRS